MGMFDRDANFEDHFQPGERFVLRSLRYAGTISTQYGTAEKSIAGIISRENPTEVKKYSLLGVGFAGQAQRATAGEFPMVVEYTKVPTAVAGQTVKLFAPVDVACRAFIDGDDGPALTEQAQPTTGAASEDIPF